VAAEFWCGEVGARNLPVGSTVNRTGKQDIVHQKGMA